MTDEFKYFLDAGAYAPEQAHSIDAGYDLRSPVDGVVFGNSSLTIDTGVHVQIPSRVMGLIMPKSGLNVRQGILSFGVVDAGYSGSVRVKLYNHSQEPYIIRAGDKVSQLIFVPVLYPKLVEDRDFDVSDRGSNGFGSSGR